jgi:class 3 adenylate cyclase
MDGDVQFTQVGQARVGYAVHGASDLDIVYAPGLASHLDLTIEQPRYRQGIDTLTRLGRVIRFDRRGTGVSDPVPTGAEESWELWADDLGAVLDAAGSQRAVIIAANDAGPPAILFSATHPHLVAALVIFNSTARFTAADDYPAGHPPEVADLVVGALTQAWGTEEATDLLAPSLAADEPFRRWYARFQRGACTPGEMAENMARILRMDARSVLPQVQCPTLVIHREGYSTIPEAQARVLADGIPGAEFLSVPGADAPIYTQGTSEILAKIGEFIGRAPIAAPDDRVLRTVLFTDIVASTERAVEMGDSDWGRLIVAYDAVALEEVAKAGGRVIKGTGDGTLAIFEAPTRAVRCVLDIKARAAELGIGVRGGLHAGPISLRTDGDISGLAVNAAARVLGLGTGDEVLVSDAVADLVTGDEFAFTWSGEHELKGLPGTWKVFQASLAA